MSTMGWKMHRLLIIAGATLALVACEHRPSTEGYGSSYNPGYGNSGNSYSGYNSTGSRYDNDYRGSTTTRQRAVEGCASGQTADFLHQNRPGGSDFNPARCRNEGY
jgi:hypothetical protein